MAGLTKVSNSVTKNPRINPNLIIDGNFDHWFEGTSQITSGYGSDTMWLNWHVGSTKTHSRQTFSLGETDGWDAPATYFSRTVVSYVAGSSNFCAKVTKIEDVKKTAGQKITVSFRAKADATKNIAIEFIQNFGSGGSPSAEVGGIGSQWVALTTSWKKYTVTVQMPSITGKTLGSDGNSWSALLFWFDSGSSYNTRTANLGQQSGTFDIAQVKLELGDVATPFVAPDPQQELARVQRYYENGRASMVAAGTVQSYNGVFENIRYATAKRATPTIFVSVFDNSGITGVATQYTDINGFGICPDASASVGSYATIAWIADARL